MAILAAEDDDGDEATRGYVCVRPNVPELEQLKFFANGRAGMTRAGCKPLDISIDLPTDDDEDGPPSPTAGRSARSGGKPTASGGKQQRKGSDRQQGQGNVGKRPYCTQKCLAGVARGGAMDRKCPNSDDHEPRHIKRLEFLRLMRDQLAEDRGEDADYVPLFLSGSRGCCLKCGCRRTATRL